MIAMSIVQLRDHLDAVISSSSPREPYDGAAEFSPFVRKASGRRPGPSNAGRPLAAAPAKLASSPRTRRYQLELAAPTARRGDGLWTDTGAEHEVALVVLMDYAAQASTDDVRELVARDDHMLLRDRITASAAPDNGVMLAEELSCDDIGPQEDPDVRRFALTYSVRYFARLSPGA